MKNQLTKSITNMIILLAIIIIPGIRLNAQKPSNESKEQDYQNIKSLEKVDYDDPRRRDEEFNKMRSYPFAEIPVNARINAINQADRMNHQKNSKSMSLAQQPQWTNIGPTNVGGRIKSIAINPSKTSWIYIGAAAGGIWLSKDAGASWTPKFDFQTGIAFGSIAIDPNNTDVIYAGTGEAVPGGTIYLGSGLFKSTDAGETWKVIGLTEVGSFSKVFVHPKNSNIIVAGATNRGQGFYISTDAGSTWNRVYKGPISDVTINTQNELEYIIGVDSDGIYYTSDGGVSWQKRVNGIDLGANSGGRISVQAAPSNFNYVYALLDIYQTTGSKPCIYRSSDKGLNWGLAYSGTSSFFNNQGFYDNYIRVNPTNPLIVFAGGIDIWRSTDGASFIDVTQGYQGGTVHVDQHCCAFDPKNPNVVYFGNDGGIYRSQDNGSNFDNLNNNLIITQFYGLAVDNTRQNTTYGGAQDNGTWGTNNSTWSAVSGGDGFQTLVDFQTPNIFYGFSTPSGVVAPYRMDLNTNSFKFLTNGLNLNAAGIWNPPLTMDPLNNSFLYHGRDKLYVSYDNGDTWNPMTTAIDQGIISAIAVSSVDDNYIWSGSSMGEVQVSPDGGSTWSNVTDNGLVNRFVTSIALSYKDVKTALVSYSGFGVQHIFKTTDGGKTFVSISHDLPDISVNSLVIHPKNEQIIFAGTDIGVFATFDGGNSWLPYGRGLAKSPITQLQFNMYYLNQPNLVLRASSYGRGMWEVPVTTDIITSPEINTPAGGELYVSTTSQVISWYGFTLPVSVEYTIDDGANWHLIADKVQGNNLSWSVPNLTSIFCRVRVTSINDQTQQRISNSFSINMEAIGSVLKTGGVSYVPYGLCYDGKFGIWSTSFYTNKLTKLNSETLLKEKDFTLPGDSLYTDLTMDRSKGILYIHRMNSTTAGGGVIIVIDTNGKVQRTMKSPADNYPIGLELVDGKLIVGDRDKRDSYGNRILMQVDPQTGALLGQYTNPFQNTYGPRSLCYDGNQYIYQVCTDFPGAAALKGAYNMKIDKADLSKEITRFPLESLSGIINARGIDFDPRDKNFWISDFGGNIYKIAGFETITDVKDQTGSNPILNSDALETKIYPNPMSDFSNLSFQMLRDYGSVMVEITDLLGQRVQLLFDGNLSKNEAKFLQINGDNLSSGLYYVVFSINGNRSIMRKLLINK